MTTESTSCTPSQPFQFGLKSLFGAMTVVSLNLGIWLWSPDLLMSVLPCSGCVLGIWLFRQRGASWPVALAFGVVLGTVALSLTIGVLSWLAIHFNPPPSGYEWVWSGESAFLVPALISAMYGLVMSVCVVLVACVGRAVRRLVFSRADK